MYKLEGYDKDSDVYVLIGESPNLKWLTNIGRTIWVNFTLARKQNGEPIDWLVISDCRTEEKLFYFSEGEWHHY